MPWKGHEFFGFCLFILCVFLGANVASFHFCPSRYLVYFLDLEGLKMFLIVSCLGSLAFQIVFVPNASL